MGPAGHDHDHDHGHSHGGGHAHVPEHLPADARERRVLLMLVIQLAYMLVELGGGLWSGSLALIADAGHMSSDAAALAVVLFALRLVRTPPSPQHTFGYHRAEVLAATVNGTGLLVIAGGILWEAWERLADPPAVAGLPVLAIATGGLVVNLIGLSLFHRDRNGDLNMRGAWLHLLSDAIGSVGAMLAGLAIWQAGWTWADPAVSVIIALLVVWGAKGLLNEAVRVLMEGAPPHINVGDVRKVLGSIPGVTDVHDLHVWTIASGQVSLSAHVRAEGHTACGPLLTDIQRALRTDFGIVHSTVQVEPPEFTEDATHP